MNLASGQAKTITVDETSTGSTLNIASGAMADTVNLDTGATVTGSGDIASLHVNASGSSVTMLPDQITIRPGITANIHGETMDTQAAAESSADPPAQRRLSQDHGSGPQQRGRPVRGQ